MDIEQLRTFCLSLPHVTEDIKWGNNLCFSIGGKMFLICGMEAPLRVSLKASEDDFNELIATNDVIPAPYLARYKWVLIQKATRFSKKEWEEYVSKSYRLIKERLPKKVLKGLQ